MGDRQFNNARSLRRIAPGRFATIVCCSKRRNTVSSLMSHDSTFGGVCAAMLTMRMYIRLWMRSTPITGDNDGNFLRKDRWIVGNMLIIAQQQLKRVVSDWKGNLGLRLSRPEMQVIEIVGYPLVQRRQRGVNQKVMVTRIGLFHTRWRDAHVTQAKADGQRTRYVGAIG